MKRAREQRGKAGRKKKRELANQGNKKREEGYASSIWPRKGATRGECIVIKERKNKHFTGEHT